MPTQLTLDWSLLGLKRAAVGFVIHAAIVGVIAALADLLRTVSLVQFSDKTAIYAIVFSLLAALIHRGLEWLATRRDQVEASFTPSDSTDVAAA